jgi:CHC2 zinc finger
LAATPPKAAKEINVMMTEERHIRQSPLSAKDKVASSRVLQRFSIERATDEELAAIVEELSVELALYQGDLEAQDFRDHDEPTLRNDITYLQSQLDDVIRQSERRLRARRAARGGRQHEAFTARFDAMRAANIVEAIQTLGIALHKRGREWWGLCPLHEERTPSFAVNPNKGLWHCHGCHRGGDLVAFVMQKQHLNAIEALRMLELIVDAPGVAA